MRQLRPLRVGRPYFGQPGKTGDSPPILRRVLVIAVLATLQPVPLSRQRGQVWISPPHRDTSPRPNKSILQVRRVPPGYGGRVWFSPPHRDTSPRPNKSVLQVWRIPPGHGGRVWFPPVRYPDPVPRPLLVQVVRPPQTFRPQPSVFMTHRPPFPFIVVVGNPRGPLELAPPPLGPLEFVEG